jgi:hypothetical protein
MIFEYTPQGGFFGYGMTRGGILTPDLWSSLNAPFNQTRYGIPNFHRGIDSQLNMWQPIYAPRAARVSAKRSDDGDGNMSTTPYGNAVVIETDMGSLGVAHLAEPCRFEVGDDLAEDAVFAYGGTTGFSTGPHAHIQCSYTAQGWDVFDRPDLAVDPIEWLNAACSASDGTTPPVPRLPVVIGDLPRNGGAALVVTSYGTTAAQVAAYAVEQGAPLVSISHLSEGVWTAYVVGAPAPVNAAFPSALPSSTALYLRGE